MTKTQWACFKMAVSIKGLIFASMFVSGVFVYCSFIVIPSIILLPLSVKYSRIAFEQLILGKWFGFVAVCPIVVVVVCINVNCLDYLFYLGLLG